MNHNLILKKYKAPLLVALSSGLRLIFSLISVKITAVILGPSGTGVIGQINNLLLILTTISGGGISAGLTNIVSQSQDKISLKRQMATAHGYGILCIAILSILLIFASSINSSAFPYNQDNLTLIVLILAQYPIFQITSISAILNAKGLQLLSSISLVLAGILNPLFIYIGSVNFGIKGCIYGIILGSVIQWPILATIAKKKLIAVALFPSPQISKINWKFWGKFTIMAVITALCMPLAQIIIRNSLVSKYGWDTTGIWQAMIRVSDAYLQFFMLILSAVYFPGMSRCISFREKIDYLIKNSISHLPILIISMILIFIFREKIILTLYTESFIELKNLFLPQLIGDFFRFSSYLITYLFLASNFLKISIFCEISQAMLFLIISTQWGIHSGAYGVVQSYTLTYFFYFLLVLLILFLKKFFKL